MKDSRSSEESDAALVARILKGDKEAYGVILERYRKPILNFTYRMVHEYETALDLSQEVFIKVFHSLSTYDSRYKFSTWMYRVASNHVIDHIRRREPRWVSIDTPIAEGQRPIEIADVRRDQRDELVFSEKEALVSKAIRKLPASYRRLILLRHVNECSYDEIARICALPLGTVKNRIFRAREMLRRELEGVL